jgi:hypothetical protein
VILSAIAVVLCLAACAAPGTRHASADEATWQTRAPEATAVRPGADPKSLLIDVSIAAGGANCPRNLHVEIVEQSAAAIYANVVDEEWGPVPAGACPSTAVATAKLTASAPIGNRVLSLNTHEWKLSNGAYRECGEYSLCNPPADHCDGAWITITVNGLDVPAHSGRGIEHCDQKWLIMTVDVNSAQCGAGGRTGCSAPPNVTRYFLGWKPNGWEVITQTKAAGCGSVLTAVPNFPRDLCSTLPATG